MKSIKFNNNTVIIKFSYRGTVFDLEDVPSEVRSLVDELFEDIDNNGIADAFEEPIAEISSMGFNIDLTGYSDDVREELAEQLAMEEFTHLEFMAVRDDVCITEITLNGKRFAGVADLPKAVRKLFAELTLKSESVPMFRAHTNDPSENQSGTSMSLLEALDVRPRSAFVYVVDLDYLKERKSQKSRGWKAIREALKRAYPGAEFMLMVPAAESEEHTLSGIIFCKHHSPIPHWHVISAGLTELDGKESPNAEISGFGFELSCRLVAKEGEEKPPRWLCDLMYIVGDRMADSLTGLREGDVLLSFGAIVGDTEESGVPWDRLLFTNDPQLVPVDTPNGEVHFVQILHLHEDEAKTMMLWDTDKFLRRLSPHFPVVINDPWRCSILSDEHIADEIRASIQTEGSSRDAVALGGIGWRVNKGGLFRRETYQLHVQRDKASELADLIGARLGHGRDLNIVSNDANKLLMLQTGNRCEALMVLPQGEPLSSLDSFGVKLTTRAALELQQRLRSGEERFSLPSWPEFSVQVASSVA